MKRILVMCVTAMLCVTLFAKGDPISVSYTTNPQMRCPKCENKIKSNVRFAKGNGIKEITTDLSSQTVTIKFDSTKTKEADIVKEFEKIGYSVTKVEKKEEKASTTK